MNKADLAQIGKVVDTRLEKRLKPIRGIIDEQLQKQLTPINKKLDEHTKKLDEHSRKLDALTLDVINVQQKTDLIPDLHEKFIENKNFTNSAIFLAGIIMVLLSTKIFEG